MEKLEILEDFYSKKDCLPEKLRNDIGHFNVFRLEPFVGKNAKPAPYRQRDYFKVILSFGPSTIHYADKTFKITFSGIVGTSVPY